MDLQGGVSKKIYHCPRLTDASGFFFPANPGILIFFLNNETSSIWGL
jgi:hypothetical protein